jgi:uncharacterized protein YfaS (alpha-2-macroglobulin family)
MIDYLSWQHETEARFDITAKLDGAEIFGYTFNAENIFKTFTHFIPIDSLTRKKLLPLTLERTDTNGKDNTLYYDMSLKYFVPVESLPPRDEGISITRDLFALTDTKSEHPIVKAKVGDIVRGKVTLVIPAQYQHVSLEDMIPAGFEIVNFNLSTEDTSLNAGQDSFGGGLGFAPQSTEDGFFSRARDTITSFFGGSQMAQMYGGWNNANRDTSLQKQVLRPSHTESHDDRVFLYIDTLSPGVYEYEYYLRALVPGTFSHLPARAEELYFPEIFGRTSGDIITVTAD